MDKHSATLSFVASRDPEPDQVHDARRARVDVQHTARRPGAALCSEHDRAYHRRLEDEAPGYANLGAEGIGAGGNYDAADGDVGQCNIQTGHSICKISPRRVRWWRRAWRMRRRRRRRRHYTRAAVGAVGAATAVRILRSRSAIVAPTI
jgi:hypothetical protein